MTYQVNAADPYFNNAFDHFNFKHNKRWLYLSMDRPQAPISWEPTELGRSWNYRIPYMNSCTIIIIFLMINLIVTTAVKYFVTEIRKPFKFWIGKYCSFFYEFLYSANKFQNSKNQNWKEIFQINRFSKIYWHFQKLYYFWWHTQSKRQ